MINCCVLIQISTNQEINSPSLQLVTFPASHVQQYLAHSQCKLCRSICFKYLPTLHIRYFCIVPSYPSDLVQACTHIINNNFLLSSTFQYVIFTVCLLIIMYLGIFGKYLCKQMLQTKNVLCLYRYVNFTITAMAILSVHGFIIVF